MLSRLRRFLDVRPGEGLPVLLTFFYIATVVASFLLAKPIRNGLFLRQYGPYAIVYVYVAVPLVLSLFVPAYTRVAARFGSRTVTIGTLIFFSANVLLFWYAFRFAPFRLLPGVFYVWVNCFAVIAPVQAWSFANTLFDTRQARRLFGLLGSIAALLFLAAVVTQWAGFQLNIVAKERFGNDADALLRFFGTFNFVLGSVSFVVQLLLTRRLLRQFGVAVTILVLPLGLIFGSTLVVLVPGFM